MFRAQRIRCEPRDAHSRARANPRPRDPPVIRTTFSRKSNFRRFLNRARPMPAPAAARSSDLFMSSSAICSQQSESTAHANKRRTTAPELHRAEQVMMACGIELEVLDNIARLGAFQTEWQGFLSRFPAPTPFQTP